MAHWPGKEKKKYYSELYQKGSTVFLAVTLKCKQQEQIQMEVSDGCCHIATCREIFWLARSQRHDKRRWQTALRHSQTGCLSPSLENHMHVVVDEAMKAALKKKRRIQNFVTLFYNTAYITTDHKSLGKIAQCATILKFQCFSV